MAARLGVSQHKIAVCKKQREDFIPGLLRVMKNVSRKGRCYSGNAPF
jgi:hypothetical protein